MEESHNRLAGETSPYLLQHARNPVAWYAWGEEALTRAREEDRPILLSIGYSACHWCHVMAHESFEDRETAETMNRLFVNIKVDREERPDLDRIYQRAHQLLTGRAGGWPLTMFLTPDTLTPFFGGTYFPREPRHGMPAFREVLEGVARVYHRKRDQIVAQDRTLREALANLDGPVITGESDPAPLLDSAHRLLAGAFDRQWGGFGQAPKFPHCPNIELLLARGHQEGDREALEMALLTLDRMAEGGIHDQVGGGFCRYSVDERWEIPHFEKMLYDNAQLLPLYAQAFAITGEPRYRRICERLVGWLEREMIDEGGGFHSALDADSEGEEGLFYLWNPDQVESLLPAESWPLVRDHYGLATPPNFEGAWHLRVKQPLADVARQQGLNEEEAQFRLDKARTILLATRQKRTRPACDDKVLTSWNALMIRGLAIAARHLGRPDWAALGRRALTFLHTTLWNGERLLATWRAGRAHLNGYLDDHAFLIDAILALQAVEGNSQELRFAMQLADRLLDHFEDRERGGFFFTSDDHETLLERTRPFADDSLPSGNGTGASALLRLGHLVGEPRYIEAAERTLDAALAAARNAPLAHASVLLAARLRSAPPTLVTVRAPRRRLPAWRDLLRDYHPDISLLLMPAEEDRGWPEALALHREREAAWVCRDGTCAPPVRRPEELTKLLKSKGGKAR